MRTKSSKQSCVGAMRKEAEQKLNIYCQNCNSAFTFLRRIKRKGKILKVESAKEKETEGLALLKKTG